MEGWSCVTVIEDEDVRSKMLDVRWHQPLARDLVPPYSASRLKQLEVQRLGRRLYSEVWEYQKNLMEQRKKGRILDTLILVEHEPVYTLGKNGDENHLLQSRRREIPVFRTERGGDVTYHGPGQLVGYPILDLHDHRMSVSWYMRSLEEVLISTLADFDITAERQGGVTGIWVGDQKIASLGVRLSQWVSMHGFALNVNTDLSYFDGIIPCGIFESGVTSMEKVLDAKQSLNAVERVVENQFRAIFGFERKVKTGE